MHSLRGRIHPDMRGHQHRSTVRWKRRRLIPLRLAKVGAVPQSGLAQLWVTVAWGCL